MIYPFRCFVHGQVEVERPISHAPGEMDSCPLCGLVSLRVYTPVYFQEDRLRFFKGRRGDGWSDTLGAPMPQSRSERRRIEKERGIVFDSQLTAQEKFAADYRRHVVSGGERVKPETLVSPPRPEVGLKERIRDYMIRNPKKCMSDG